MKTQLNQNQRTISHPRKTSTLLDNSLKIITLLSLILILSLNTSAQTRVVYGEVYAFKNVKLGNVVIESKKTGTKTTSDTTGMFNIICKPRDVLIFKAESFTLRKVRVRPKTDTIYVDLEFTKDNIEDAILAIGYGYTTKKSNSYAHSNLTTNDTDFCQYSNMYDLIRGRFPVMY